MSDSDWRTCKWCGESYRYGKGTTYGCCSRKCENEYLQTAEGQEDKKSTDTIRKYMWGALFLPITFIPWVIKSSGWFTRILKIIFGGAGLVLWFLIVGGLIMGGTK